MPGLTTIRSLHVMGNVLQAFELTHSSPLTESTVYCIYFFLGGGRIPSFFRSWLLLANVRMSQEGAKFVTSSDQHDDGFQAGSELQWDTKFV